jgi:hypothetical protein
MTVGKLITKKGKRKESNALVLNILEATVRINSAEYTAPGTVITKDDGSTFTIESPRIHCEMEVLDTGPRDKKHIGTTWWENLYYPETKKGSEEYENRPGTKLGNLTTALYGEEFWSVDGAYLNPDDLNSFEFVSSLEPRKKFGSNEITGTQVNHKHISTAPDHKPPTIPVELSEEDEADMQAGLGESDDR